ncbi:Alkaline phosphatase synthesis transcriptional regulatory protein PhoP [Polystyrenella longa]|uniref:Alkaline phosphatase synthesis transcriptional regulatory protein PhoP n=1 Tax=Polystyrenella longa TaxID=2528007 RepID=A0A518CRR6_9PLAN|nr:response regulator [Polystyrenella longa]QDU81894.1 Alkaline phosphatase synthesis transcriptional regulatory protein PhoP [Polystyrenella longa]
MSSVPQRILVVEDNKAMSSVLRFNIQRAGYEVFVANNGVEGLEIINQHAIEFIISDYQMPQMGGYDFALQMRKTPGYESVPLAMCSAKGFELNPDELSEKLQVIKLFYKPFSPREIVNFINETLSETVNKS